MLKKKQNKSLKATDKQLYVTNGRGHGRFPLCFLGNLTIVFESSFLVFQKKIIRFLIHIDDSLRAKKNNLTIRFAVLL